MKDYGLVMMSITEFVVTILVFLFGGRWYDHHIGFGSRYMVIGAIAGFVIGVTRMVVRLKGIMDEDGPSQ